MTSSSPPSEVERARAGDENAWRLLYERHADFVFGIAHRGLGERSAAVDVLQETFLRAARQLHRLEDPPRFRSWLGRLAEEEVGRRLARRAPPGADAPPATDSSPTTPSSRGIEPQPTDPPPLAPPERELAYTWVRRQLEIDPWRRLWKWAVAAALILLLLGLWGLHRAVGGAAP